MDAETERALEIIRRDGPNLILAAITNIHERTILEQLNQISASGVINPARAKTLWRTLRVNPLDQVGLINPYTDTDRIDRQAINYFHQILNDHLPQITYPAREALGNAIQQSAENA